MVLREDQGGVIAIGQASHAWISGQLARAWGNARFGVLEPLEEVCLAAEQHDVGMAEWDLAPTRNPQTGLPHSFTEMPLAVHLELWRAGPQRLRSQSRYAALLVSMHGRRLYERRDLDALGIPEAAAVRAFLADQRAFQEELLASLRGDRKAAGWAAPRRVERNSQLLWTWDLLSLALCLDWSRSTAHAVPTADGAVDLNLHASTDAPGQVTIDPWPFSSPTIKVRCEGRSLPGRYGTDEELHDALAGARWESVEFELGPGE